LRISISVRRIQWFVENERIMSLTRLIISQVKQNFKYSNFGKIF